MKRKRTTTLMIVFGVTAFLAIVSLSLGAWFFASAFEATTADAVAATQNFDDVRHRFGSTGPVFEIGADEEPRLRRQPPAVGPAAAPQTLHVRHWGPDDDRLSDVSIPFWLLRLKAGAFSVSSHHAGLRDVTAEQIERYGPTLLVDHQGHGGDRLLIWTE